MYVCMYRLIDFVQKSINKWIHVIGSKQLNKHPLVCTFRYACWARECAVAIETRAWFEAVCKCKPVTFFLFCFCERFGGPARTSCPAADRVRRVTAPAARFPGGRPPAGRRELLRTRRTAGACARGRPERLCHAGGKEIRILQNEKKKTFILTLHSLFSLNLHFLSCMWNVSWWLFHKPLK